MSDRRAGLYLHVPFCRRVCPYCDFAVRTGDATRRQRYVDHLLAEIALHDGTPLEFDTIYFGGGTPSLLDPEQLDRILDTARRHLRIAPDSWIFLEGNPEDVTPERAGSWVSLGVKTLSLGVQSLDAEELEFLGRHHSPEDARRSIDIARDAGFHTVSIDLIYGLPGQTGDRWQRVLDHAIELAADHASCYQLTIHDRTRFGLLEGRGRLRQLSGDDQATLFGLTHQTMNAAGMQGYEVSQFAVSPDHRSRHNMKYWDHTPYLGLGPSAHSYHDRRRWWNIRRNDAWQDAVGRDERPVEAEETLDSRALALESLMTGLRRYEGLNLGELRNEWGIDVQALNGELIRRLENEGLAALNGERLVLSLDGLAVADGLTPLFELGPG